MEVLIGVLHQDGMQTASHREVRKGLEGSALMTAHRTRDTRLELARKKLGDN